ncbi:MAG: hypothetical protein NE330_21930 [Lentisphaeraceae bacterium]|nr:hypothetical protein [Lentisphaeraceae bacterium]
MFSYKKKLVVASITIHAVLLTAGLLYWLLNAPPESKEPSTSETSTSQSQGESSKAKKPEDIVKTKKRPTDDLEVGDVKPEHVKEALTLAIKQNDKTAEENLGDFDEKFDELSRTSVADVKKIADFVASSAGATLKAPSKKPRTEVGPQNPIDPNSVKLADYEVNDKGEYILIYADKNNVFLKDGPYPYKDIDESTRLRLSLIKRGKENKKIQILLNTTDALLDALHPVEERKTETK